MNELMTAREVCDRLRISTKTLGRWRKARLISAVKKGQSGHYLYPAISIERLIASRTVKGVYHKEGDIPFKIRPRGIKVGRVLRKSEMGKRLDKFVRGIRKIQSAS